MVSCHGVNHYSGPLDSDFKVCDLYTGGIVELVAERTGVSFISNVYRCPSINPHAGTTTGIEWLKNFITRNPRTMIIDIHGCKNNDTFDFALGTSVSAPSANVQKAIEYISKYLTNFGIRVALNPLGYSAKSERTLTKTLINNGHSNILQIEISRRFREPDQKLNITLQVLTQVVNRIKNEL